MPRFSARFIEDFEIAMQIACLLDPQFERCPACDTRCKSSAQLQQHLQEKHSADIAPEVFETLQKAAQEKAALLLRAQQHAAQVQQAAQLQQQHANNNNNNPQLVNSSAPVKCQFCADKFVDDMQRHVHVLQKHANELRTHLTEPIADLRNAVSPPAVEETNGGTTDMVKCPQLMCNFRTQHAENLAIHLQLHAPLDAALAQIHQRAAATIGGSVTSVADDVAPSDEATSAHEDEDDDEAMQATTEVALQMAKANQQKQCPCPVATCQRLYHDLGSLEKHIARVHRWQFKLSPKKPANGIISPSKIVKLKKRYACQFAKCHQRFATRQLCREHVLTHFPTPAAMLERNSPEERQRQADESADCPQTSASEDGMDTYVREENEHVVKDIHTHLERRENQKEHEQHSHTSGSTSPISENIPEGFARPTPEAASQRPFTVQSFLMREYPARNHAGVASRSVTLQEMIAHLPVRTLVTEPVRITVELVPAPHIDAQILHV